MYLDLNQNIDFILASYKRFAKNEKHVTRQIRDDVLILMLDGTLYFTEDGEERSVGRGQYYIQRGGLLQSALRPSCDAHYAYFHFYGSWRDGGVNALPPSGEFDTQKLYRTIDRLCRDSSRGRLPLVSVTRSFFEILESLYEDNRSLGEGDELAEKLHGFLSEHYTEDIDSTQLAERFSYSSDYLIRVFKRAYGTTPHSFVANRRIEYARLLLSTTNDGVGEIAEACGYSDFTTFYRAFCSRVGLSPTKWRSGSR